MSRNDCDTSVALVSPSMRWLRRRNEIDAGTTGAYSGIDDELESVLVPLSATARLFNLVSLEGSWAMNLFGLKTNGLIWIARVWLVEERRRTNVECHVAMIN